MIDIHQLIQFPKRYEQEYIKRSKDPKRITVLVEAYQKRKGLNQQLDNIREEKNIFSKKITQLTSQEKDKLLVEMKALTGEQKALEERIQELTKIIDTTLRTIPNLSSEHTPPWKTDTDNIQIAIFNEKPFFDFTPVPYRELPVYEKYIWQQEWSNAMWSRGYYMKWAIAKLQKVLMDYALEYIMKQWYELMYAPLLLNQKVLTGTGHLPDFDGQQYEVPINEHTNYYMIGSSEPSIMGYYMWKNLWTLEKPILATCMSTCFRKESGSYGKDQKGILRVHQFEKVEMIVICRPEDAQACFEKHAAINENLRNSLWLHYKKLEVCTWDMPSKHHRQQDYDMRFPGTQEYREVGSNGNASDYQNRGLKISYTDDIWKRQTPRWLNDTWMTFRTWLAILEQYQQADGTVKVPEVLIGRFGSEYIT